MESGLKSVLGKARYGLGEFKAAPIENVIRTVLPEKYQVEWIRKYHLWKASLHPQIQSQLRCILSEHADTRAVIVFAPGLDWHRQLFQRPQQLALALANQGALVFYAQLTPLQSGAKIQSISNRLYVCSIPLEHFSLLEHYFLYLLSWNHRYLLKFDHPFIYYDYLDEITTFAGDSSQLKKDHSYLLQAARLVTATARSLLEDAQETRPDTLYVPNGVDFAHFDISSKPEDISVPEDMASFIKAGKPVIGYYGALANWFDYELLASVAVARKDLNFVLIGSNHDGSLERSGILGQANISYLGPKPYRELPAYLAWFDVAILPFKLNKVTHSTSPIKLFEYFAGGKPVVSTPLKEVLEYPIVFIGMDSQSFCQKLDEALSNRKDAKFVRRLKQTALEITWNIRAEQILKAIEKRQL